MKKYLVTNSYGNKEELGQFDKLEDAKWFIWRQRGLHATITNTKTGSHMETWSSNGFAGLHTGCSRWFPANR